MKLSELKTIIELMEMSLSEDISDKARATKAVERLKKAEASFREKMYKFDDESLLEKNHHILQSFCKFFNFVFPIISFLFIYPRRMNHHMSML